MLLFHSFLKKSKIDKWREKNDMKCRDRLSYELSTCLDQIQMRQQPCALFRTRRCSLHVVSLSIAHIRSLSSIGIEVIYVFIMQIEFIFISIFTVPLSVIYAHHNLCIYSIQSNLCTKHYFTSIKLNKYFLILHNLTKHA